MWHDKTWENQGFSFLIVHIGWFHSCHRNVQTPLWQKVAPCKRHIWTSPHCLASTPKEVLHSTNWCKHQSIFCVNEIVFYLLKKKEIQLMQSNCFLWLLKITHTGVFLIWHLFQQKQCLPNTKIIQIPYLQGLLLEYVKAQNLLGLGKIIVWV